uniref:Uncharacterized protein n=1 Tax=Anguilla anguilla TaxID=7936 RepID=A0A0E9XAD1_ANGAN
MVPFLFCEFSLGTL